MKAHAHWAPRPPEGAPAVKSSHLLAWAVVIVVVAVFVVPLVMRAMGWWYA